MTKKIILFLMLIIYILFTYFNYELIKYNFDFLLIIFFAITFIGNVIISLITKEFKFKIAVWTTLNFGVILITFCKVLIHEITGYLNHYTLIDVLSDIITCFLIPNWMIPCIYKLWKTSFNNE